MQFLFENRALFQHLGILVLFIATLRWGSAPERWSAGTFVLMVVSDIAYHLVFGAPIVDSKMDVVHFALDMAATLGILAIALCANRIYPVGVASFQLISLSTHFAESLSGAASMTAYQIMSVAPSYFMMLIVAVGLALHRRRLRKFGQYRSWRTSPRRSLRPKPPIMSEI